MAAPARSLFRLFLRLTGRLEHERKRLRYGPVVEQFVPTECVGELKPPVVNALAAVKMSLYDMNVSLKDLLRTGFRTGAIPAGHDDAHAADAGRVSGRVGTVIPLDLENAFSIYQLFAKRVQGLKRMTESRQSVAETRGIEVAVGSSFLFKLGTSYAFEYSVSITNNSTTTVKLLSRYWEITDLDGKTIEVEGPGVVGKSPVLKKTDTYRYSSSCSIETLRGTMSGHYVFEDLYDGELFMAKIAPFALASDPQQT